MLGLMEYYFVGIFGMTVIGLVIAGFLLCCYLKDERDVNEADNEQTVMVVGGAAPQPALQRQATNANLGKLSRMFDWRKFNEHNECSICLEAFTSSDMVTPLPCDKRHYFHSQCIQEWSQNHSDCPLCKKPFTAEDLAAA